MFFFFCSHTLLSHFSSLWHWPSQFIRFPRAPSGATKLLNIPILPNSTATKCAKSLFLVQCHSDANRCSLQPKCLTICSRTVGRSLKRTQRGVECQSSAELLNRCWCTAVCRMWSLCPCNVQTDIHLREETTSSNIERNGSQTGGDRVRMTSVLYVVLTARHRADGKQGL